MMSTSVVGDTGPAERPQPGLHVGGQRGATDVEAKLDRRGHLVDVLSAGSRRANEPLVEVSLVDRERPRDRDHLSTASAGAYSRAGSLP